MLEGRTAATTLLFLLIPRMLRGDGAEANAHHGWDAALSHSNPHHSPPAPTYSHHLPLKTMSSSKVSPLPTATSPPSAQHKRSTLQPSHPPRTLQSRLARDHCSNSAQGHLPHLTHRSTHPRLGVNRWEKSCKKSPAQTSHIGVRYCHGENTAPLL